LASFTDDDRGQALADVLTGELLVALEQLLVRAVLVDHTGQRGPEAFLVGATLVSVDRVREGVDALAVRLVPLHRDLNRHAVALGAELDDRPVDRGLGLVEVPDEVGDPALVAERDFLALGPPPRPRRPLVLQRDGETPVEEGHLLQPPVDRLVREVGGLEDVGSGQNVTWCRSSRVDLALFQRAGPGVGVLLPPDETVLLDLDRHAAVESALTTETPTPCRPPDTAYALPSNLPPA
jgi:hypothetical protein